MPATLVAENTFALAGSASGVVIDLGSAPTAGQWDTLLIVSNGIIQVQVDFATEVLLNNAASTFAWREATGAPGEQNVTITTPQGAVNLLVRHQRWDGVTALDVVDSAMLETPGTTSPTLNTGPLADTGELSIIALGMIGFSVAPSSPVFSGSYVNAHPGDETTFGGTGSDAVGGWVGYFNNAGTAAETPSVSWTTNVTNRYGFVIAFTAGVPAEVTLSPATLTFEAVALTPEAVPATVALEPAVLTFTAPELTPTPAGGVTVELVPAALIFEVPEVDPVPANDGTDGLLFPEAELLLACLRDALNAHPDPPGIICLRAGDHVIQDVGIPGFSQDECCAGQAYVRIVGFYMTGGDTTPFPSPSTDAPISPCDIPAWGLQLEMGVFRCVRTDRSLTCTEWTVAAARQMADAKAMRAALCCFQDLHDASTVAVGTWSPSGVSGGCLGSTWPVSVEVLNCGEC